MNSTWPRIPVAPSSPSPCPLPGVPGRGDKNGEVPGTGAPLRIRRGNAIIEAALVLPILLVLAFGTVEFGYYFYVRHNLQGAAREGVRAAITASATNSDVNSAVANAMTSYGLQNSGYTVTFNPSNIGDAADGASVTVTVQCNWGTVGVRPLGLIGSNKVVAGRAVMRKEG